MSKVRDAVLARFLRYVRFDTQSREGSSTYPSTPGQVELLQALAQELRDLGAAEIEMDQWGYVTATIPATTTKDGVPTIGFLAHVDTSPEMPGADVEPIVHLDYQGQDLVLPADPTVVLRFADNPALADQLGHDIVTASGTTLLGADDKAGVAEVMTAAEYLLQHPEIPHGVIRLAFTPDEEIGKGTEHFDIERFGARYAYTLDGGGRGEVEGESFSADTMVLVFRGFNTHPGYAKDRLINSIKVAADFVGRLPREVMSPETTDGFDGYVHPYSFESSIERTTVKVLLRDFRTEALAEKEAFLRSLAHAAVAAWPGSSVETRVDQSYRNMREVLEGHPEVLEHAREAIRRVGLAVKERPIRGGTDGSRLSLLGLPTPNLFAGEHNIHSRLEWVSAQDMEEAVKVIVEVCRVWEEEART